MMEACSTVSSVYVHVIEDVVAKVRDDFAASGVGEEVLGALQAIWEAKMAQLGAITGMTQRPVRPVRPASAPSPAAVHDLNVPYDGSFEGYETPTAEMLFPPTPQFTPARTPLPGTVQTPPLGTTHTPLPGNADQSSHNMNIPTGPSQVNKSRNAIDMNAGRPTPFMHPPSSWMNQRPLGVDVNVAYVEGHDDAERRLDHQPMTQDFFVGSSGKRKRDDYTSQLTSGGYIPQRDGSGDMIIEFQLSESNASEYPLNRSSGGSDISATVFTKEPISNTLLAQQDGVNDEYDHDQYYHYQGVAPEDYNAPYLVDPRTGTPVVGTPYAGTPIPAKTEALYDDEPPLNEDDDDADDLEEVEQANEEPNTQHLVLAQFDKVTRTKSRWKCTLKSGIMHYNNRDVLFNRASGEFEF